MAEETEGSTQDAAPRSARSDGGHQRRRSEILDAAAEIFCSKGYDATSIQDIASEVGILKGSLYYYIDSKDDLLFHIINESHEAAVEAVSELENVSGDPLDLIHEMVRKHVDVFTSTRVKSAVFFREFRALSAERQAEIRREGDYYSNFLRAQILAGQRAGLIDAQLDPKLTSIGILGMLNGMSFWYRPGGDSSPGDIGREFSRIVVMGVVSSEFLDSVGGRDALLARWS